MQQITTNSIDYNYISNIIYKELIMMKDIICINDRSTCPNQIKIDQKYKLDIESIFGDSDGDWYGTIYDLDGNKIGQLNLKHFRTI